MTSFTCIHTNGVYQQYKGNICNRAFKCGSELPEYVALILRNGGSQSPDRWLRELRNNQNLDAMLNKAYNQIKIAEEMVEENKTFILEEYFGESFKGIIPDFVDYFVITNYSVGTGRNCILPSPIILESHYLSMMKLNNGMYNVHYALSDNGKGYIQHVEKRYARYLLSGYKIMVPEYLFKINAPRL